MKPYEFKYKDLDPACIRPIGDRYLVEVLETDEQSVGGIFLPERSEQQRGWAVGVVVNVGNGHRLEIPDPAYVLPEGYEPVPNLTDDQQMSRRLSALSYTTPVMGDKSTLQRLFATVPMFFGPGEVIFMERYSGREFVAQGRTLRFVSQVDCLGPAGIRLVWTAEGWQDEPAAEPATNGKPSLAVAQ